MRFHHDRIKRSGFVWFLSAFLGVAVFLSDHSKAYGSQGNPVRGKKIYQGLCIQCHGVKGDGNGVAAPALMEQPANFTDPKTWKMGDEAFFIHVIRRGRKIMPAFWDVIDPQEIRDVLSYERTFLKKGKGREQVFKKWGGVRFQRPAPGFSGPDRREFSVRGEGIPGRISQSPAP